MCHQCVINSVKAGMLSRRAFFKGSAAAGAAANAATAAPKPLFAQSAAPTRTDGDVDDAVGRDQPLLQIGQEGMLVPGRWNLDPEPARNAVDNISARQMTHLANPVRFGAAERHLRVEYAGYTKAL